MDSDDQSKAFNSYFKELNKGLSGINRLRKQEKLNQKINKQLEILKDLRFVSDSMHAAGASEPSIRLALQGTYEYLRVAYGQKLEKSAEEIIRDPDSRYEHRIEAPLPYSQKLKHNKSIGYGKD